MDLIDLQWVQAPGPAAATTRIILMPGAYQPLSRFLDHDFDRALYEELMLPAREGGLRLWLGGVSLGGFMALRAAAQYPDALAAILAGRGPLDGDDDERRIWRYVINLPAHLHDMRIFLGFGADDRFDDTQRLLARRLPATAVTTRITDGDHDWPAWRALWQEFLPQL